MTRRNAWGYRCATCREWIDLSADQTRALTLNGSLELDCPHCGMKHRESLAASPPPRRTETVTIPSPEPEPPAPWQSIIPDAVAARPQPPRAEADAPPWPAAPAPLPFERKPGKHAKPGAAAPPFERKRPRPEPAADSPTDADDRPTPRPRRALGERFAALPKVVQILALFAPLCAGGVALIALTGDAPRPAKSAPRAATAPTDREGTP